ncbi:MAG TPA: capsular polysaccharide biosynthesis protein, partial [Epsilonproteobacteria bacterium]|nr:capsular polysaccharide biosynthesis protein [Campylobacterota bacterium]
SKAISLIKKYHVSKYNNASNISDDYFTKDEERVLVIAQTAGDASLEYGMLKEFTTQEIVNAAINENPNAVIYIKIHPDVLSGKKKSDIDIKALHTRCKIISEDLNPISLLQHFKKVYTKTSGMGFEALLVGCECVCFGMPYYAGWGLTDDRVECKRRKRLLRLEEVFAAAYILYTRYYNPYTDEDTDILGAIEAIVKMRN